MFRANALDKPKSGVKDYKGISIFGTFTRSYSRFTEILAYMTMFSWIWDDAALIWNILQRDTYTETNGTIRTSQKAPITQNKLGLFKFRTNKFFYSVVLPYLQKTLSQNEDVHIWSWYDWSYSDQNNSFTTKLTNFKYVMHLVCLDRGIRILGI
jgi:hypothetical protein